MLMKKFGYSLCVFPTVVEKSHIDDVKFNIGQVRVIWQLQHGGCCFLYGRPQRGWLPSLATRAGPTASEIAARQGGRRQCAESAICKDRSLSTVEGNVRALPNSLTAITSGVEQEGFRATVDGCLLAGNNPCCSEVWEKSLFEIAADRFIGPATSQASFPVSIRPVGNSALRCYQHERSV